MRAIAVIDIGKSNAKLSLVDERLGTLITSESRETGTRGDGPYPHLDAPELWHWYLDQLKRARQLSPISYICVTSHGAAGALVDDTDLTLPVLDYEFAGPDELGDVYDALCDPFEVTLSPRLPHGLNLGRQIFWQRERFPEQFAKTRHILTYPQYWTWKLTGKPACEVTSIGAHTDLWNPIRGEFSTFAKTQGFADLVPPIMQADAVLGPLRREVSDITGIEPDCKVQVGIHDSNASLVPYLKSRESPFTVVSTGTWVISFAVGAALEGLDPTRDCIANVNVLGDPVACSRYMGGREFEVVSSRSTDVASISDLIRLMDNDVFALPAFTKEGGPFQNHEGRIESNRALSPTDRYALASLYCALVSDVSLTLCGSLGDIIVEGAYAKNTLLLQVLAAVRDSQKVFASTDNTGTTIGTAMLATDSIAAPSLAPPPVIDQFVTTKIRDYQRRWQARIKAGGAPSQDILPT